MVCCDSLVGELKKVDVALPSDVCRPWIAPGSAFGPEGEGFVRWCFAASEEKLADGVARLRRALKA
jgi:bifunctional pyridoxal-dependent enzyme with beta-cystathionase and maltose regulon repressor activities